ncbi:HAD family hydrolase [Limisalsivibrio acetivorans]|uniref:HAD family hydrolase n=1 Tax=Limisalsivibrio acetivorans TaxID=1304888 RepID=UPI0003B7A5EA|nr:HAD family hydrolase [Limisalsivibrio acetivorans]
MKKKLLVFDIDGTLCEINSPAPYSTSEILRKLSKKHYLAVASGKPACYISGLVRQLGIPEAAIIGENGGTVSVDGYFPPSDQYIAPVSEETKNRLELIKTAYISKFGNKCWIQPNVTNITMFPFDMGLIGQFHDLARTLESETILAYYHSDCVDFVPKGTNKGTGVAVLAEKFGLSETDIWVFGDGANDFEMFRYAGNTVCVGNNDELAKHADHRVESPDHMAEFLEERFQ